MSVCLFILSFFNIQCNKPYNYFQMMYHIQTYHRRLTFWHHHRCQIVWHSFTFSFLPGVNMVHAPQWQSKYSHEFLIWCHVVQSLDSSFPSPVCDFMKFTRKLKCTANRMPLACKGSCLIWKMAWYGADTYSTLQKNTFFQLTFFYLSFVIIRHCELIIMICTLGDIV